MGRGAATELAFISANFTLSSKETFLIWGFGACGEIVWSFIAREYFILLSIIIVLVSLSFAFVKPYGITLSAFIGYGFLYLVRPKQYIWQRQVSVGSKDLNQPTQILKEKSTNAKQLDNSSKLADILDNKRYMR